jgi:hypothetical protein
VRPTEPRPSESRPRTAGSASGSAWRIRREVSLPPGNGSLVGVQELEAMLLKIDDIAFHRCSPPVCPPSAHRTRDPSFQPERQQEVPWAALREAVVNALVHRDCTIPGPTRISVFDDRVEVRSPGRPPHTVDAEAMRAGAHVPRNPHIYSRIADLGLVTRAGSGVPRIARQLRETSGTELGISISDAVKTLVLPRRRASPRPEADESRRAG